MCLLTHRTGNSCHQPCPDTPDGRSPCASLPCSQEPPTEPWQLRHGRREARVPVGRGCGALIRGKSEGVAAPTHRQVGSEDPGCEGGIY